MLFSLHSAVFQRLRVKVRQVPDDSGGPAAAHTHPRSIREFQVQQALRLAEQQQQRGVAHPAAKA